MARISTYPNDTNIAISDKLLGTDEFDLSTRNFAIGDILAFFMSGTSGYLPVFNDAGTLQNSVIFQDDADSPTLLTFSINSAASGNFTVAGDFAVGGTSNFSGIVNTDSALNINSGVYFNGKVYDYAGVVGNSEQVLVSDASGNVKWENYQGSGLEYQAAWDANTDTPDLTAQLLDASQTGKYWVVSVAGNTALPGYQGVNITDWQPGDWAIISEDSGGNVFWDKIDNTSVLTGSGNAATLAIWTNTRVLGDSQISWFANDSKFVTSQGFEFGSIYNNGAYYDNNDDTGNAGQVLSSTGNETEWVDLPVPAISTAFIDIGKVPIWIGSSADKELGVMLDPAGGPAPGAGGVYGGLVPVMGTTGQGGVNSNFISNIEFNMYDGGLNNTSTYIFNQMGQATMPKIKTDSLAINSVANPGAQASLDVGAGLNANRAAVLRGGVVISNNPSGVSVDDTSLAVGSGNNDIIDGSDHSAVIGDGNVLTKSANGPGSDNSLAVGYLNTVTDGKNSFVAGSQNTVIGTAVTGSEGLRTQVLGLQNQLTNTFASLILGGQNVINTANSGVGQNTFVLGYNNEVQGFGDNVYIIGNASSAVNGSNQVYVFGNNLDGRGNSVVLGAHNNPTLPYSPNGNQGLGSPALEVGTGNSSGNNQTGLIVTKDTGGAGASGVRGSRVIMKDLVNFDFADDTAAGNAGIPVGALYHTSGVVKVRLT